MSYEILVIRHPSWPTLAIDLPDGSPMPKKGAVVDTTAEPWKTLLERELIVVHPDAVLPDPAASAPAGTNTPASDATKSVDQSSGS